MKMMLFLPVLLLLCASPTFAWLRSAADTPPDVPDAKLCAEFASICAFVAHNCSAQAPQDSRCVDSFQLFYRRHRVLSQCAEHLQAIPEHKINVVEFLERYNQWQTAHACELFHSTEKQAATECSFDSRAPWAAQMWPLYCQEVFAMYGDRRHELDRLCERTENSEAFWEGYAEYSATETCKEYYELVRRAREKNCGEKQSDECVEMFSWYKDKQREVETQCLELRVSKPFYRGFYKWKKLQT